MTDDTPTIKELEEKIAAARSGHMDAAAEKYRQQLAELGSSELSHLAEKHRTTDASLIRAKAANHYSRLTERLKESSAGLHVDGTHVSVVGRDADTSSNDTGPLTKAEREHKEALERPLFRREGGA